MSFNLINTVAVASSKKEKDNHSDGECKCIDQFIKTAENDETISNSEVKKLKAAYKNYLKSVENKSKDEKEIAKKKKKRHEEDDDEEDEENIGKKLKSEDRKTRNRKKKTDEEEEEEEKKTTDKKKKKYKNEDEENIKSSKKNPKSPDDLVKYTDKHILEPNWQMHNPKPEKQEPSATINLAKKDTELRKPNDQVADDISAVKSQNQQHEGASTMPDAIRIVKKSDPSFTRVGSRNDVTLRRELEKYRNLYATNSKNV
jgi:hypothetical protein